MEENGPQPVGATCDAFPLLLYPWEVSVEHQVDGLEVDVVPGPSAEALRDLPVSCDLEYLPFLENGADGLLLGVDRGFPSKSRLRSCFFKTVILIVLNDISEHKCQ